MTEEWRVTTLKEWIRPVPEAEPAAATVRGAGCRLQVLAGTVGPASGDTFVCTFPHVADGDWDTDGYILTTGTRLWTVPAGLGGVYNLELYNEIGASVLPASGFVTVGFLLPDARSVSQDFRYSDFKGSGATWSARGGVSVTTTLHAGDAIDIFITNGMDVAVFDGSFIQTRNRFSGWLLIPDPVPGTP